jgi:hypothetical protein
VIIGVICSLALVVFSWGYSYGRRGMDEFTMNTDGKPMSSAGGRGRCPEHSLSPGSRWHAAGYELSGMAGLAWMRWMRPRAWCPSSVMQSSR